MKGFVKTRQAQRLLHNKCVLVLGGSVQRSMYKDLVRLLQTDNFLTLSQLKSKGEHSFESDRLVEGGCLGLMANGIDYREVRQYHSDHHLLRFYFITRVYSPYMQTILEDLRQGLKPDLIIVSSCVWDMTRYGLNCLENYKENLHRFFGQIKTAVCHDCLIIWTLAMPLAKQIRGGFLVSEVRHLGPSLCTDIIEANFYGGQLADAYGLDTLDLHFHFRLSLQHRMPDGVHWDALAHRAISSLLLLHVAQAWGVVLGEAPCASASLLPSRPPAGSAGEVSKKKRRKAKVKWFPPPPPPPMAREPGPAPWCPRFRPPGAPRQHFPGPGFRMSPFPRPLLPPPWRMMTPSYPPFRRPPPDWGSGGWGGWPGGGCVRWRRPYHRIHPYYPPGPPGPPGPRRPMWGCFQMHFLQR
uniref:Family with sequence similarity 113 n=1 Tax=Neogobius melanostomus TaxID=47308 RepID=A0A8C6TA69_9GOBI